MIQTIPLTVTVAGSAGSATGSATTTRPVNGLVYGVYIDYTSQPATTDVTLATQGRVAPAQTLLVVTNANTDSWFYPRPQIHTTAGAAISAQYGLAPVDDYVIVSVAQGDPGSVVVYLLVEVD